MQGRYPLSGVSAIFCRCFAERVPEGRVFDQKGSQNYPKWGRKGTRSDQNGAKREPKRGKGTYKGLPCGRKTEEKRKGEHSLLRPSPFWVHFGSIFSKNQWKNDVKKHVKNRCQKYRIFSVFASEKHEQRGPKVGKNRCKHRYRKSPEKHEKWGGQKHGFPRRTP